MRRVVIHEILVGTGVALLVVAAFATGAAQRSLGRFERAAAELRQEWEQREGWSLGEESAFRQRLEEAEFEVRGTRELRAQLWRPGGMGSVATVAGLATLLIGGVLWRRTRTGPSAADPGVRQRESS
ncbi:MAG: hypothetical protein OEY20_10670 [Gemmatimonadota bacterium]|nr:hypothetical protein [Gemmatimonadota bacterium]MDH4351890.1 hypothetical protein [Gemmatimonadota bacterium]MDH5197705.1 hypothetical protein [Gemmatimonadota bacterium]